jgi:hypothetical protein
MGSAMNVPGKHREPAERVTQEENDEICILVEKSWNRKKGTADASAPSVRQVQVRV